MQLTLQRFKNFLFYAAYIFTGVAWIRWVALGSGKRAVASLLLHVPLAILAGYLLMQCRSLNELGGWDLAVTLQNPYLVPFVIATLATIQCLVAPLAWLSGPKGWEKPLLAA